MKAVNENGILTITLCDRIDTLNAQDVQEELLDIVDRTPDADEIVLDAAGLNYISSAGFRVILVLCEKESRPVRMTNVSDEIYSVCKKVGFTIVMRIDRREDKD